MMMRRQAAPLGIARHVIRSSCVVVVAGCGIGSRGAPVVIPATAGSGGRPQPDALITLERRPCFGTCAVYLISIAGDGSMVFDGRAYVHSPGRTTSQLDSGSVAALIQLFDDSRFFELDDRYLDGERHCLQYALDAPIVITSIAIGGRTKRVEHDLGCDGVPAQLTLLEGRIDELARVWRWTTGLPPR